MSRLFLRFGMLGAAQLAGSALSFLTAIIITRVGGAALFGQYSVGLSVLAYGLVVTNFGTDISGVRMAAAHPDRISSMLPAILVIRLFFASLIFAIILLFSPILAPDLAGRSILLIISTGLFAGALLSAWLPQGIENIKVTALIIFGPFTITFAFTVISALFAPQGVAFAFSRLAGDALIAVAVLIWSWRFFQGSSWSSVRETIRELIGQSSAIAGSEIVRGLAFLSDMLIISFVGIGLKVFCTWRWDITGTAVGLLLSEALLLVLLQRATRAKLRVDNAQ